MTDSIRLAALLTPERLCQMAGSTSYERGVAYARDGRVQELSMENEMLTARVAGTATYRARLRVHAGRLDFDCTCPVGNELRFCKHCVAAGLAWILAQGGESEAGARPEPPENPMDRLRAHLEAQDAPALRALLLAEAARDDGLRDRLLLRGAVHDPDAGGATARLRAALDHIVRTGGFVGYDEAPEYAGRLLDVAKALASLARANPAAAIPLVEHAIRRVEAALGDVDDSGGAVGGVLETLAEVHLQACLAVRPDPVELARSLFRAEMESQYDTFSGAAQVYAEALGETGLAEYRRLAEREWEHVPALGPGERDSGAGTRWRITSMMEALARADGGLEALVEVKSRDLSTGSRFLQVAQLYRDAEDHDRAEEWARRGLTAFPANPDARLRLFVADECHRRGRHDEAMQLAWAVFTPDLDGYRTLHEHAQQARCWPAWRERALAALRADAERALSAFANGDSQSRTELVRVFLWEGDAEAAWAEATAGGCTGELWLELARAREAEHPADALAVYRRQIGRILQNTGDRAYTGAIKLLPRVRETMARLPGESYAAFVAELRAANRRRRKFVEMLDRAERRARPEPAAA